jgi:WD40 repeat protein
VPRYIRSLAFSSDSTRLAIADARGATIWDVENSSKQLRISDQKLSGICILSGNKLFATIGGDGYARVRDIKSGTEIARMQHEGADSISTSPDGECIVTSGAGTTRLWRIYTGVKVREYLYGNTVRLSPNARHVAIWPSLDSIVHLLDLAGGDYTQLHHPDNMMRTEVQDTAFSTDGRFLAVSLRMDSTFDQLFHPTLSIFTSKSQVRIWDVSADAVVTEIDFSATPSTGRGPGLAFSPDDRWLAIATTGHAMVWDLNAVGGGGPAQLAMNIYPESSWSLTVLVAFSPDGQWLAVGHGKQLQMWHIGRNQMWYSDGQRQN